MYFLFCFPALTFGLFFFDFCGFFFFFLKQFWQRRARECFSRTERKSGHRIPRKGFVAGWKGTSGVSSRWGDLVRD